MISYSFPQENPGKTGVATPETRIERCSRWQPPGTFLSKAATPISFSTAKEVVLDGPLDVAGHGGDVVPVVG